MRANTDALVKLGHWGVPLFAFQGELFWGQDRIEDVEAALLGRRIGAGVGRPPNLILLITDQQRAPQHWPADPAGSTR